MFTEWFMDMTLVIAAVLSGVLTWNISSMTCRGQDGMTTYRSLHPVQTLALAFLLVLPLYGLIWGLILL